GRGAGRVEQDRIKGVPRLPLQHIGHDNFGGKAGAGEVLPQSVEPTIAGVDCGYLPAGRSKLQRLPAGRRAEVEYAPAFSCTEQSSREGGGEILHPPRTVGIARQV